MKIIAHRGFSSEYNENTIIAFSQALLLDIDGIELDVQQVEDELLVFHDPFVDKLTDGQGMLRNYTLADARQLLVHHKDPIPTLQEVAALIGDRVTLNIEIKSLHNEPAFVRYVEKIMRDYHTKVVLSSFDHPLLLRCQNLLLNPTVQYGGLIAHTPLDMAYYSQALGIQIAAIDWQSVNKEFVDDAHTRGIQVWCYTVNNVEVLAALLKLNVDAIFTDNPIWAKRSVAELSR